MITITDLFCGAGGSSSGAIQVPGVRVRMAANHWRLAVDTHNTNHPDADHDCADISQTDPRRYPTTDILWASPECTNHSQAKGRKRDSLQPNLFDEVLPDEAAERSRATMFDVLRFAEVHRYAAIVVENVVDVRDWVMWPAWTTGLDNLGYDHQVVYLNSMFAQQVGAPAPQSRDRLYVVAWRKGNRRPDLETWTRPTAWCPTCDRSVRAVQAWKRPDRRHGRYRQQYVFRCPRTECRNSEVYPGVLPAAVAIDWSLAGERIGDRARPLAAKTLARIEAGLRRYAHTAQLVPAGGTWNDGATPVTDPFRTRTTRDTEALVVPLRNNGVARPAGRHPAPTVAAAGNHHALVMRNNTPRGDAGQMSTPVSEPIRTITTAGHQSLIRWDHLLVPYYTTRACARPVSEPIGTITTVDTYSMVGPSVAVNDCTFRMLEPREIQAAMAFGADYRVLGNKREQVRQLGNAVTPPAARDLIAAVVESLTGHSPAPRKDPS